MAANLEMTATHRWVQEVFGIAFTGQKMERGVWVPVIHVAGQEIRLKPYATRLDFLNVWSACGGPTVSAERINKASLQ